MSKYDEKLIDTAVNWWAEKVTGLHHHDNGDRSKQSALGMMMADILMKPVSEDQAEVFKRTLKNIIIEEFDHCDHLRLLLFVELGCDYFPNELLRRAEEAAEIPVLNFPFKTWMKITETEVMVYDGYAAPQEIIYTSEGDIT